MRHPKNLFIILTTFDLLDICIRKCHKKLSKHYLEMVFELPYRYTYIKSYIIYYTVKNLQEFF